LKKLPVSIYTGKEIMEYYLAIGSKRYGPYTDEQVSEFITSGRVKNEDLVWDTASNQWVKLQDYPPFYRFFTKAQGEGYLVNIEGQVRGPLTLEELSDLAGEGSLTRDDLVWNMTINDWEKAGAIAALAGLFTKAPPQGKYFVSLKGKTEGPFNWETLKAMADSGEITPESYFYDGKDWKIFHDSPQLGQLFAAYSVAPPAPPDKSQSTIPPPPTQVEHPQADSAPPYDSPPSELLKPAELETGAPPDELLGEQPPEIEGLLVGEEPGSPTADAKDLPEDTAEQESRPESAEAPSKKVATARKKPEFAGAESHYKKDVSGLKASKAFLLPSKMIDGDTISVEVGIYNRLTKIRRLFAIGIDTAIMIAVFLIVLLTLTFLNYNPFYASETQYEDQIMLLAVFGGIFMFYFLFRDGFTRNGSFGKKVAHIYISSVKSGRPCGVFRSFIRNFFLLIPPLQLIDLFIILFSKSGRRVGDYIAGTMISDYEPRS
jgi:uncharacterized RDD family membrane protein YckC